MILSTYSATPASTLQSHFLGMLKCWDFFLNGKMNFFFKCWESSKFGKGKGKNLPVMAYWVAGKTSCHVARNGAASRYACKSPRSQCTGSSLGRGHICHCSPGFRGNPYLAHGCRGVFLVVAIKWIVWTDRRTQRQNLREEEFEKNGGNLLLSRRRNTELALYTDQDMESITNKYKSKCLKLISCFHGAFYHGTLLNNGRSSGVVAMVIFLSQAQEKDVVRILGCCLGTHYPLIV